MANDPEYFLNSGLTWFSHVTPEAFEASLEGFPLTSRHSVEWLTGTIRRIYFSTVSEGFEDYPGTAHVRAS
jgi:hypothetical protein